MAAKDIQAYRFKPGQSGNPKGRPPSRVPDMVAESLKISKKEAKKLMEELSRQEVDDMDAILMLFPTDLIAVFAQDPKISAYLRTYSRAVLIDLKNGRTTTMDKLRERKFGKPTQHFELTGKDGAPLMQARRLTKEEAKDLLESMDKEY